MHVWDERDLYSDTKSIQKDDPDPDAAPHVGASVINMLFMVCLKRFQNASNKYEIMLIKSRKIHLWT